ncbi:Na+/H+ antiporter NhaA [Paraburkholderia guartelaensis]|uniref:Na+/H+ antiporter NhaA n=1 Tax=Paraburkholderia guartelaensis TaxID=2546446 RepID=UPI002AB72581|nr:Na+/H+ antiporter NhaA [Paraburkholderia guartelaensis]
MFTNPTRRALPRAQRIARKAVTALDHFLHIEAASGIVLLAAAALALLWANSQWADLYHAFWETPLTFGAGKFTFTRTLEFWINDALMTVFFLVVGIEIRRELHEGALSELRQAVLPLGAAIGGVGVPALIYIALNHGTSGATGWAVPTATDIAFAVGVLALLGRSIPANVRIFLLTLAIVDDIIAIVIIACFYSSGLDYTGFAISAAGIALVFVMQRIGVGVAPAYILPGAVIWVGLLVSGAHPTLAGVILGLMTPVVPTRRREHALVELSLAASNVTGTVRDDGNLERLAKPIETLRLRQRELLPPVLRVQWSLHPWVAYGVMPLFALANAGVNLTGLNLADGDAVRILAGVAIALVAGKPLGVFGASWVLVRIGLCRLPNGVSWAGVGLIAMLAGIGFTMSVFIAMLAFDDPGKLSVAKLGVLIGSLVAGALGLGWGVAYARRANRNRI